MTATAPSFDYAAIADSLATTLRLPDAYSSLTRTAVLVTDINASLDLSPGGRVARRAAKALRNGGVEGVCLSLDSMRTTRLKQTLRILRCSQGSDESNNTLQAPLTRLLARAVRLADTDPASSDISSPSAAASSSAPSTAGTKALGDKPSSPRDSSPPTPPGALVFSPHPIYVVERFVRKVLSVRRGFVPGERAAVDALMPLPVRVRGEHLLQRGFRHVWIMYGLEHLRGQVQERRVREDGRRLSSLHLPPLTQVVACPAGQEVSSVVLAIQDSNPEWRPVKDVPRVVVALVEEQFLVRGRRLQRLLHRVRVGAMVKAFRKGTAQVSALQRSVEQRLDYYHVGQLLWRALWTTRAVEMEITPIDPWRTLCGQSHETIRALTSVDGKPLRLCPLCRCAWHKNTEHCCCKCCECDEWDRAEDEEEDVDVGMFGFGGSDSSSDETDDNDEDELKADSSDDDDDDEDEPIDYAAFYRQQLEASGGVIGVSPEWLDALKHGLHERLAPRKINETAVYRIAATLRESIETLPTTRLRMINLHDQSIFFADAPESRVALESLLLPIRHGLEVLVLSKCALDDEAHCAVARAVLDAGEDCRLQCVDVRENQLMVSAYGTWADALEVNTSLEQLYVSTMQNKTLSAVYYSSRTTQPRWVEAKDDVLRFYTAAFAHPVLSELLTDVDPITGIPDDVGPFILHIANCLRSSTRMQTFRIQEPTTSYGFPATALSSLPGMPEWPAICEGFSINRSLLTYPFSYSHLGALHEAVVRNRSELARALIYHTATSLPDDVIGVILAYIVINQSQDRIT